MNSDSVKPTASSSIRTWPGPGPGPGLSGRHGEVHRNDRIRWLRASVLGANDGIVSTASLILGVVAAGADYPSMVLTSVAGLIAGAMSMAAGEYVSVNSQRDTEHADLAREAIELRDNVEGERQELARIYMGRGLDAALAQQVAVALMAHDALGAHARDELGLSEVSAARPLQAAWASAASFAVGAVLPIGALVATPQDHLIASISASSLLFLAGLGALSAHVGGASRVRGAARVAFWGALAMGVTSGAGALFGVLA